MKDLVARDLASVRAVASEIAVLRSHLDRTLQRTHHCAQVEADGANNHLAARAVHSIEAFDKLGHASLVKVLGETKKISYLSGGGRHAHD